MARPPDDLTLSRGGSRASTPGAPPTSFSLVVLHSPSREHVGRAVPLARKLRLGRVATADVELGLDDPRMSRVHAALERAGMLFELEDLGSRNGTFVNGERIEKRALGIGDIIRVGDTLLEIGPPPEAPAGADPSLAGRAPPLLQAVRLADAAAFGSDLPVLLLGETGTGKDVLARRIHARGGRRGAFVAVNCAALPRDLVEATLFGHRKGAFTGAVGDADGFFAQAEDGTLFLDEIGELPLPQQAKLLRVLESHEYVPVGSAKVARTNARILAATNVDLREETTTGGFRADLYARLAGVVIRLPPLRARRGDILTLAERFLSERSPSKGFFFSANAAETLLLHPWPHNVRELRTTMSRVALQQPQGGEIARAALAAALDDPVAPHEPVTPAASARKPRGGQAPDREELIARLTAYRGNVNRLAQEYGKDPKQIYRWLRQHDLDPATFR